MSKLIKDAHQRYYRVTYFSYEIYSVLWQDITGAYHANSFFRSLFHGCIAFERSKSQEDEANAYVSDIEKLFPV